MWSTYKSWRTRRSIWVVTGNNVVPARTSAINPRVNFLRVNMAASSSPYSSHGEVDTPTAEDFAES